MDIRANLETLRKHAEQNAGYVCPPDPPPIIVSPKAFDAFVAQGYIERDGTITAKGMEALSQGMRIHLEKAYEESDA